MLKDFTEEKLHGLKLVNCWSETKYIQRGGSVLTEKVCEYRAQEHHVIPEGASGWTSR